MGYIILTCTPQLSKSLDFYDRLGFLYSQQEDRHFVYDRELTIEIDESRFARPGIKMYATNLSKVISQIQKETPVYSIGKDYFFSIPGPLRIYLSASPRILPPRNASSQSMLGQFAGISIEAPEPKKAASLCRLLGFELSAGKENSSWFSMKGATDGNISFMIPNVCPHLFFNPSLTFFNGKKNLEYIKKVRASGVEITEEVTVFNERAEVDNIVLRDPGGYGIFMFNDGE